MIFRNFKAIVCQDSGLVKHPFRGQILYQFNRNPMETLFVIAVIYFGVNYTLGQAAQGIERRVTGSRR